jgi:probable rRNA maturation factor
MSSIKVMVIKRCEKADLSAINLIALDKTHKHLKIKKPVVFFFIDDTQMLKINQNSLGHYEEDEDIEQNEVVVSWERLEENAITFRTSFTEEVHRVCIHSLLHLAGQKDKTKDEKEKMRSLEDKFLNLYCST